MILIEDPTAEKPLIDDATAWQHLDAIDGAEGPERDRMARELAAYADAEERQKAEATEAHFDRVFTDPAYFDELSRDPVAVEAAKYSPFPKASNTIAANRAFLAAQRGVEPEALGDTYEAWRDGYAQHFFNKPAVSDEEFFGLVGEQFKTKKAQKAADTALQGDAVVNAFEDLMRGTVAPTAQRVREFRERNPDAFAGVSEADMLKGYGAIYDNVRARLEPYQVQAKQAMDILSSATGAETGGKPQAGNEQVTALADSFATMTRGQRDMVYEAVALAAKSMGRDQKGGFQMLAESFGRGISDMTGKTTLAAQEMALRAQKKNFSNSKNRVLVDAEGKPYWSRDGVIDGMSGRGPDMERWHEATPEEREALISGIDAMLKRAEIVRELRSIAEGAVDPIRPNKGGFINAVGGGAIAAARSLPYTATAAIPFAGPALVGAAIYGSEYDRMRLEYPNMDPDAVAGFAGVSAALQAPIEWVQSKALFGRLPATGAILKRMGDVRLPLVARVGVAVGGNLVEQNAQEWAQDAVPVILDSIGAAVREDMPEFDPEKAFRGYAGSRVDTFFAVLPLALIGGGAATFHEFKRGEAFTADVHTLQKAGFSPKVASDIAAEPDPEVRDSMVAKEWPARTDANIKKGIAMHVAETEQARADQSDPAAPTLETAIVAGEADIDGNPMREYVIRDAGGVEIYRTRDMEAAVVALGDVKKTGDLEDLAQVRAMIAFYENDNAEAGRDPAAQTFEVTGKAQSLADSAGAEGFAKLMERMRIEGLPAGTDPATVSVLGENIGQLKDGLFRDLIKLHKGATAMTVVHERLDGETKRAIAEGRRSRDWFVQEVTKAEEGINEVLLVKDSDGRVSDQSLVEAVTKLGEAYFAGRLQDERLPGGLRGFFREMVQYFKELFQRAGRLRKAMAEGKVSEDFAEYLADSVGLPMENRIEQSQRQAEADMLAEAEEILKGAAQGAELLDAVRSGGGLPSKKHKGRNSWRGELDRLEDAAKSVGKGAYGKVGKVKSVNKGKDSLFRDDAPDPDVLIQSLREQGFDFQTPDDLFTAMEERFTTGRDMYGYVNDEAANFDRTFSIQKDQGMSDSDDYRMGHRPRDDGPRLNDLLENDVAPRDIYDHPGWYVGDEKAKESRESIAVIRAARGKPDVLVTVYRSAPAGTKIKSGDWVSLSKTYAKQHGYGEDSSQDMPVISQKVPASHVKWAGDDLNEFGYYPPDSEASNKTHSVMGNAKAYAMQSALSKLRDNPAERLEIYERARQRLDATMARNAEAIEKMKAGGKSKVELDRARLVNMLGEFEAVLSVLPPAVRGRIGGFKKLAEFKMESARLKYFATRMQAIADALEVELRDEYGERIKTMLEKAKPKAGESGLKRSTLGPDAQDVVNLALRASYLDEDGTGKRLAEIEALISNATEPEVISRLSEEWTITNSFGDLANRPAASLAEAFTWLRAIIRAGRSDWRIREQARMVEQREMRADVVAGLGEATRAGLQNKDPGAVARAVELLNQYGLSHLSFEQFMHAILPESAYHLLEDWAARVRRADNASRDMEIAASEGLMDAMREAADAAGVRVSSMVADLKRVEKAAVTAMTGRKVAEERISIELAQKIVRGEADASRLTPADVDALRQELAALPADTRKEFISIQRVIFGGRSEKLNMSRAQAIQLLLSWRQPDVQSKMRREGWTEESIAQMEAMTADPASQAAIRYLSNFYARSRDVVNPVYSRMFGMNMPQVKNYAPTRYRNANDAQDIGPDGSPGVSGGVTPGFAKSRVQHSAPMRIVDAFTVYSQHVAQQAHWSQFAELYREVAGVLKAAEVRDALEQTHGLPARQALEGWLEQLAERGGKKSNEIGWLNNVMSSLIAGKAVSSLGFNLRTVAMQVDSAFRFAFAMDPKNVFQALSDIPALMQSLPAVWHSDTIQRRLHGGATPEARFLLDRERERPGFFSHMASASMLPMQYFDAAATTLSSAIVFRDAYQQATEGGANEVQATAIAADAMDAAVYRFSQPSSFGAKSLMENQGNILFKSIMLFMSDPRLKTGILMNAVRNFNENPAQSIRQIAAVEALAVVSHVVASLYRDAFSDDEDKDIWGWEGFARALALAPLQGFFFAGAVADSMVSKILGMGWFAPSRDPMLELAGRADRAGRNIDDLWSPESSEDFFRELNNIARMLSVSPAMAAPAAALNVIKPVAGAAANITQPE